MAVTTWITEKQHNTIVTSTAHDLAAEDTQITVQLTSANWPDNGEGAVVSAEYSTDAGSSWQEWDSLGVMSGQLTSKGGMPGFVASRREEMTDPCMARVKVEPTGAPRLGVRAELA